MTTFNFRGLPDCFVRMIRFFVLLLQQQKKRTPLVQLVAFFSAPVINPVVVDEDDVDCAFASMLTVRMIVMMMVMMVMMVVMMVVMTMVMMMVH